MREIEVRIDVLRQNVKVTELPIVAAPVIRANADSEIKTSLTAKFADNEIINWLTDELNPILTIDGVEHSFGIFSPTTYSLNNDGAEKTISVEAYDRCWLLKIKKTDSVIHLSKGTNYVSAIISLLTECGIALVNSIPTALTLANDREDWEIGTDYLKIVNTLLDEISYNQIYFNSQGYAVIEPKQQFNGEIKRNYDFNNIKYLCKELNTTIDFFNAPNVFICVCSNPDHSLWVARGENRNPTSPLSIVRRGREIVEYVKVDNIASENELKNYASNLAFQKMLIYQKIELTTGLMFDIGFNEIVAIIHDDFYGMAREISWTARLEPNGEMTHVLEATSLNVATDSEDAQGTPHEDESIAVVGQAISGIAKVGVT